MLFKAPALAIYIRIIAIVAQLLGLNDAARLLGINLGAISPLETMGSTAFAYLGVFTVARLFASVGLWIKSSWGAFLMMATTVVELALYIAGNPDVRISAIGFGIRIVIAAAVMVVFVLDLRLNRAHAAD